MSTIKEELKKRILIIDGAMGTMIQQHKLTEGDFRGERFKNWPKDVKEYLQAGADIIETNTFSSTSIAQADYDMQSLAYELNKQSATCAKKAIEAYQKETGDSTPKFVAGAIGPLNKTLSLSPDVNNPGYRAVSFDEVADAYTEQIHGLAEGGVDVLLIETIFDTLNAKAAIFAAKNYFQKNNIELPIMISGTITDASGRTLSGQTLESFYISIQHANPLSVGLNCALGAKEMRPHIEELSGIASCFTSAYPNAGLPNSMGEYDEQPHETALIIEDWAKEGFLNIVGGCCGTTPNHIKAIAQKARNYSPRPLPVNAASLSLA